MIKILFVDDSKLPKEFNRQSIPGEVNTTVVRKFDYAILELETEEWDELWLDRDLQDPRGDGFAVLTWLSEHPDKIPAKITITSDHFLYAKKMREMVTALMAMRKKALAVGAV